MDAVGIFRKSGGKQRINHLKEMIEGDPGITKLKEYSFSSYEKEYIILG